MCGRFTLRTPLSQVAEAFDLPPETLARLGDRQLRFNIAPSQEVAAVLAPRGQRELSWLQWGLIPSWADDPAIGNRMINARGDTVAVKPAFRQAFRKRRCLIAADGFFEWKKTPGGKQPHYIRRADQRPFAFAGLWEHWAHEQLTIDSCTIITTDANDVLRPLHNRMPVILDPGDYDRWLDPQLEDPEQLEPLLVPWSGSPLVAFPVSSLVNSPRHDEPQCIAPAAPGKVQGSLFD